MKPSVDQSIVLSAEESEYIRTILGNIDYDPSGSELYLNEVPGKPSGMARFKKIR